MSILKKIKTQWNRLIDAFSPLKELSILEKGIPSIYLKIKELSSEVNMLNELILKNTDSITVDSPLENIFKAVYSQSPRTSLKLDHPIGFKKKLVYDEFTTKPIEVCNLSSLKNNVISIETQIMAYDDGKNKFVFKVKNNYPNTRSNTKLDPDSCHKDIDTSKIVEVCSTANTVNTGVFLTQFQNEEVKEESTKPNLLTNVNNLSDEDKEYLLKQLSANNFNNN